MIESPPVVGAPALSVIICSQPRSGSTLLCDLLGMAGHISRPEEWLIPTIEVPVASRLGLPPGYERIDYIRALVQQKTNPEGVFSVKIMGWNFGELIPALRSRHAEYAHQSAADILADLFPHPRYISLRRRDQLSQAVSYARAVQTQVWKSAQTRSSEPSSLVYSHLQIQHLLEGVRVSESGWDYHFASSGIHPLELVYEDLIADPMSALRDIHAWLGLPPPVNEAAIRERCQRGRQSDGLNRQWADRYLAEETMRAAVETVPAFRENSFTLDIDLPKRAMTTIAPEILTAQVSNQATVPWKGSDSAQASDDHWVVLQGEIEGLSGLTPERPYIFQELPFPLEPDARTPLAVFLTPIKEPGHYPLKLSLLQKREGRWHPVSNEVTLEIAVAYPPYRQQSLTCFPDLSILGDLGCHVPGFGHFFDAQFPWICHDEYGWLFIDTEKSNPESLWLHDEALGWMHHERAKPQTFFIHEPKRTLQFLRREGENRIFTDLETGAQEAHPVRKTND